MKIQHHRIDANVVVGLLVREFRCSGTDVSAKVLAMYAGTRTSPMEPQWLAAGLSQNHIDLVAAKELGISVCNAAYPPNGVADFTVMMILMCLRQYKQALWRGQVNDFSLQGLQGRDMNELTIGVMGTGRIGLQVLKNLSGFGCRLLAYDVYKNPEAEKFATYVD